MHLVSSEDLQQRHAALHGEDHPEDSIMHHHAYRVTFVDADKNAKAVAGEKRKEYYNYILGNDPQQWKAKVPLYGEITYQQIYPGIDIQYYFSREGNLKYDLIISPRADVQKVAMRYEGADNLRLSNGSLVIETSVQDVLEVAPYAYQERDGQKINVRCEYHLKGNVLTFDLGHYDHSKPLVIDPRLVFSTFTGSSSDNFGFTATPGADGSLYAAGIVYVATGMYPVTLGAYQLANHGGNIDIGISRFAPDGTSLKYSTYLGGSEDEIPYSLYENMEGSLVVMGSTGSANFPVSANAYLKNFVGGRVTSFFSGSGTLSFPAGSDLFVTILDSTGGTLKGSTYFGGSDIEGFNAALEYNYGDIFRGEVIADSSGNIFAVSSTYSGNLPVTGNAFIQTPGGKQDGFACSFNNDLSTLRWSTYVGGSENDNALSIKRGTSNEVYICGGIQSWNLPFNQDAYNSEGLGGTDGYILKLKEDDGAFMNGTYNGTVQRDVDYLLEVDRAGKVYVMGQTRGLYPVDTVGVYQNPGSAQFIQKFTSDLKTSLKATVFGDSTHNKCNISPTAFMVDNCGNIYVSGWGGGSINTLSYKQGNVFNLPLTNNAIQSSTDGADFYFFVLDATWKKLNYASYFGGSNEDHVDGGTSRFAKDGTIYQAVCAGCGGRNNFPTSQGAYSRVNGSFNCNLAALKIDFEAYRVNAELIADIDSSCIPYTAHFTNRSYNGDIYIWKRPGGASGSQPIDSVEVNTKGEQIYQLIAIDTTCGFRDTTELRLYGFQDSVFAAFDILSDSCSNNFQVELINKSLDADTYRWDFGDGKLSNQKAPVHGYSQAGTYTIKLYTQNSYCQLIDSARATVHFKKRVSTGDFDVLYTPCSDGSSVRFISKGTDFQKYKWDFGDGTTGEGPFVEHDFKKSGTFRVHLNVSDTLCNRSFEADTLLSIYSSGYHPIFPNVFTPNGDGLNEYFGLPAHIPSNYISHFNMKIFNRWGTMLYETNALNKPWNGTSEGNKMAEGVYFYLINVTDACDRQEEYKGFVHLLNTN